MTDDTAHGKARDLVEDALGRLGRNKPGETEALIGGADVLDPQAACEVLANHDEDAGSDHTATTTRAR